MDNALQVFAEKGISATTIKEISQRAKVTAATLYYHFRNRENLINQTLDHFLTPALLNLWATAEVDDPKETLKELLARALDLAQSSPWFLPLWSREFVSEAGSLREFILTRFKDQKIALFLTKIQTGQAKGVLNPKLAPELVFLSIVGTVFVTLLGRPSFEKIFGRKVTDDQVLEHIRSFLTTGLLNAQKEDGHEREARQPRP
jgi:AcrR family transcriptional regulator